MSVPHLSDFCVCQNCGVGRLISEVGWAKQWMCPDCIWIDDMEQDLKNPNHPFHKMAEEALKESSVEKE